MADTISVIYSLSATNKTITAFTSLESSRAKAGRYEPSVRFTLKGAEGRGSATTPIFVAELASVADVETLRNELHNRVDDLLNTIRKAYDEQGAPPRP